MTTCFHFLLSFNEKITKTNCVCFQPDVSNVTTPKPGSMAEIEQRLWNEFNIFADTLCDRNFRSSAKPRKLAG